MNRHEIINFYEKEFLVWQDAVVGNRTGHPNTDSLIEPEDICDVTDGGKRHVFCLLVYYNFIIHLSMHHYHGGHYPQKFPELVPYKHIRNTFNFVNPNRYVLIPIQKKSIQRNRLGDLAYKVFDICIDKTIRYFSDKDFDVKGLFNDILNDEDIRDGDPFLLTTLKVLVDTKNFNTNTADTPNEDLNNDEDINNDEHNDYEGEGNEDQTHQRNIDPYIWTVNAILDRGSFTTTYKFALLRALADWGKSTPRGNNTITLVELAEKFIQYYWNLSMKFKIKENNYVMKEIKKVCERCNQSQGAILDNFKTEFTEEYNNLVNRVRGNAFKDVIRRLHKGVPIEECAKLFEYDDLGEEALGDELTIPLQARQFLISHYSVVKNLALGSWVKFTEKTTNSPRLYQKISGEVKRESLDKYDTFFSDDRNQTNCFYCNRELIANQQARDHVIPWSFILEDKAWNLVLCCQRCNSQKGDKIPSNNHIESLFQKNTELLATGHNFVNIQARKDFGEWADYQELKTHIKNMLNQCRSEGFEDWINQ
jgi:5-methylcytosine-specific restriction endonuclease McrA|tara:strand:+ start:606 stop:2213 length:1608 start_codon:yes stop_codon:yes gene_type:complete